MALCVAGRLVIGVIRLQGFRAKGNWVPRKWHVSLPERCRQKDNWSALPEAAPPLHCVPFFTQTSVAKRKETGGWECPPPVELPP